jgi:excisionase family DNA binding protein
MTDSEALSYLKDVRRQVLPLSEAADLAGVSVTLLDRWARSGAIPAIKIGRHWFVGRKWMNRWKKIPRKTGRKPAESA